MIRNKYLLPLLICEGGRRERGRIHGEAFREMIQKNIYLCKYMCSKMRNVNMDTLLSEAKKLIQPLRRYDGEIMNEMIGIAEGANVSLVEIVLLNARSELMNRFWNLSSVHEGCTTFAVMPREKNGNIYIAQTWDWLQFSKDLLILLCCKGENGVNFLSVTEPGVIANVGINNKGIAVFLNYISVLDTNTKGSLYHVLLRRALESDDIIELQRNLVRSPIAFAIHIMATNHQGMLISNELTSAGIDFRIIQDKFILHTNHILSDKLKIHNVVNEMYQDSEMRYSMAQKCLEELIKSEDIDVEDIYDIFRKHSDDKGNICKHADLKDEFSISTLFTLIYQVTPLGNNKLYMSVGKPCESELFEIDILNLLS